MPWRTAEKLPGAHGMLVAMGHDGSQWPPTMDPGFPFIPPRQKLNEKAGPAPSEQKHYWNKRF